MKSTINNLVLERGILTSAYKKEIRENVHDIRRESLLRIKNKIKRERSVFYSETTTAIKISVFAIALVMFIF